MLAIFNTLRSSSRHGPIHFSQSSREFWVRLRRSNQVVRKVAM